MGFLDQAIRQHLELKRKHGADDQELKLEAEEALSPVRSERAEPPRLAAPGDAGRPHDPTLGDERREAPTAAEDPDRVGQGPLAPAGDAPVYGMEPSHLRDEAPADQYSAGDRAGGPPLHRRGP